MSNHVYKKTDGGPINQATAKEWIDRYQQVNGKDAIRAYFFGTDIIDKVLRNTGAVGLRVYLGLDEKKQLQMVLVGTKEDGSDTWPDEGMAEGEGPTIGDGGFPCPPYCDPRP